MHPLIITTIPNGLNIKKRDILPTRKTYFAQNILFGTWMIQIIEFGIDGFEISGPVGDGEGEVLRGLY